MCARFARSRVPDEGDGDISDAAFGVVFPLAGGRCVPRTGVRLDCPLEVASPASLPCLSLLPPLLVRPVPPRGQARWVGGRRWRMPRRRRPSQRWTWKFPFWGKTPKGKHKSLLILFKNKKKPCARDAQRSPTQSSDDTHITSMDHNGGTGGTRAKTT